MVKKPLSEYPEFMTLDEVHEATKINRSKIREDVPRTKVPVKGYRGLVFRYARKDVEKHIKGFAGMDMLGNPTNNPPRKVDTSAR